MIPKLRNLYNVWNLLRGQFTEKIMVRRTNNTSHISNAGQIVIYVSRNGDGNSLYRIIDREDVHGRGILTIMMTIVLWPSEKKRPHVTDNCPSAIRPLVALSIALFRGGQIFTANKKDCYRYEDWVIFKLCRIHNLRTGDEPWFHLMWSASKAFKLNFIET